MGVILPSGSALFVRRSYLYRTIGHKPIGINLLCHKDMANAESSSLYQGIEPSGTDVYHLWLCLDSYESIHHLLQHERIEHGKLQLHQVHLPVYPSNLCLLLFQPQGLSNGREVAMVGCCVLHLLCVVLLYLHAEGNGNVIGNRILARRNNK